MEAIEYQPLAVALGLGLLVGMQRQRQESEIAGIRTFPFVTLLGAINAQLDTANARWLTSAGLLSVAFLLFMGNQAKLKRGAHAAGMTTEAAALLMYSVGAMLGAGFLGPAIAIGGACVVLLQWKEPLHGFARRLGERDFRAIMNIVLIALVILPVLPDRTYGPFHVLNPYRIWMMVVLIAFISLMAYVAFKVLGARVGAVLGGVLGGLISSTATTVSHARQTKTNPGAAAVAALVILIASTVVNARVMLEISVVAPRLVPAAFPPLVIMMGVMSGLSALLYLQVGREGAENPNRDNPTQLKAAIVFGALYALILLGVAAAKEYFGAGALYGVAIISGLTDVDAIALSTAELAKSERIEIATAWRVILLAIMSNLMFKGVAVALLGSRRLLAYIAVLFAISLATGGALLAFWPDWEV
ncbi:MAG: MgtC/SapB family protein [Planctomycetales bacterium]|nr:MgtC/SapB family protein [Planctomycetales bacterium]